MISSKHDPASPTAAIIIAISAVCFIFFTVIGMAGSYVLYNHAIGVENTNQANLQQREAESQLRSAIPTCRALGKLSKDATQALPELNGITTPDMAVVDFFKDFGNVYHGTNCVAVIQFANKNHIK